MGCMFPQAENLARYWANIRNKVDAIAEVPASHWSVADYYDQDPKAPDRTYAHRGGFLTPVDFPLLDFGIAPHSIEATDSTQLLGLMVARAALDDAGCLGNPALDRDRVSVILGVTGTLELVIPLGARLGHPIWRRALQASGVDERTTLEVIERIASSYVGWQENSFPGLLGNVAAGRIANRLDLKRHQLRGRRRLRQLAGGRQPGHARAIAAGRCDLAVTGGLDTFNDIFMYMCFSKTPALSPTGDARPFDADADGTILGEGLGVLVLKRLADARRDGDRIYAVIRSIGTSSDGMGQAVYAPSPAGQAKALGSCLRTGGDFAGDGRAGRGPRHRHEGRRRDRASGAREVYRGERATAGAWCALGSVKSQVGHTKAAAGAAGLIKAALALYHKVLPPTAKVTRPIEPPGRRRLAVLPEHRRAALAARAPTIPRRAAVSAFGFGGSNFHCVLEEAEAEAARPVLGWRRADRRFFGRRARRDSALARCARKYGRLGRPACGSRAAASSFARTSTFDCCWSWNSRRAIWPRSAQRKNAVGLARGRPLPRRGTTRQPRAAPGGSGQRPGGSGQPRGNRPCVSGQRSASWPPGDALSGARIAV